MGNQASLTHTASPLHTVTVDPKLTYHGHLKHLHPQVRQNLDDFNEYPFEDEFDKLNPGKKDDANINAIQTLWTDIFLYWLDDQYVQKGSYIAFFSDINPARTMFSVCYR